MSLATIFYWWPGNMDIFICTQQIESVFVICVLVRGYFLKLYIRCRSYFQPRNLLIVMIGTLAAAQVDSNSNKLFESLVWKTRNNSQNMFLENRLWGKPGWCSHDCSNVIISNTHTNPSPLLLNYKKLHKKLFLFS